MQASAKKQLYLAWLFQALTSICEGAIYFMLFLAIKDILDGSFTREKLIQYSLMFLVYTVLHFVFYYFTIAKQRPVSYAMMRDETSFDCGENQTVSALLLYKRQDQPAYIFVYN